MGHECLILNFAAACIRDEKGRVLLQKRGDNKQWGFPGGLIEIGESADETVIREVKEETGLDIVINKMIGVYSKYFYEYPNNDKAQTIGVFFDCSAVGGQVDIDYKETLDLVFYEVQNIPLLFNKQQQDALDDFLNNRNGIYR